MRLLHTLVCLGLGLALGDPALADSGKTSTGAAVASATTSAEPRIPFRDVRNAGVGAVQFAAAQLTRKAPCVVILGATTASWHKARAGIRQAIIEGFPVEGVLMGPTDASPAFEVYAHGRLVTRPIDLDRISLIEITDLLRDISREYYAR